MIKHRTIPIDQSNIAKLASPEHHAAMAESAKTEPAWKGAGQAVGVEIWRIYNFAPHKIEGKEKGSFFDGDSYIILHTYKSDPKSNALKYDLYFWLGTNTSQDEAGTAAYKTVELDELLGGAPVQHREVQSSESPEFLGVFGGRITILSGGMDSAFNIVKPEAYKPRLLHLKGKRNVRVTEVPLSCSSLNQGDVFILDAGLSVYQWFGSSAGVFEKRKSNEVVADIKSNRNGRPNVILLDGEDNADFWNFLGGKGAIAAATADDEPAPSSKTLLRLSDAGGSLTFSQVATAGATQKFPRNSLQSNDVFVLDCGYQVFTWVGKDASKTERTQGILSTIQYLSENNRPVSTSIARVVEGGEYVAFDAHFAA